MRKLLNTLYVSTQGAYLFKDGETLAVRIEKEVRLRLPLHTLQGVVCFGNVAASPFLMGACAEHGITLSFLTEHGRFLARVEGPVTGNILLRRAQFRVSESGSAAASIAKMMLLGKLANARLVLLRAARERPELEGSPVRPAADALEESIRSLEKAETLERLRGIEGDAAREYFGAFDSLILENKDAFFFHKRSRRPPLDNVNSLLSFLYTLLVHDCRSALESVGLDPQSGFLHALRPGRPALALDLMEELRPMVADRLALSLINRRQVCPEHFQPSESGAILMTEAARKEVLVAWQKRKQEEIRHPFLDESIPIGMIPYTQALLLARHLRGDLDVYPPFVWR
jgi:CRISP-associated protein Cas1